MAIIKLPDFGPKSTAPRLKYKGMMDAWEDIRNARLIDGLGPAEIYRRFNPMCQKKFKMNTLVKRLREYGVNKARQKIEAELRQKIRASQDIAAKEARRTAKIRERNRLKSFRHTEPLVNEAIADVIVERKKAAAVRHFERIDEAIEKAHDVVAKQKPTQKNLGYFLGNVDRIDQIARKTYGIADEKPVTPHQLNVAVLLNFSQSTEDDPIDV